MPSPVRALVLDFVSQARHRIAIGLALAGLATLIETTGIVWLIALLQAAMTPTIGGVSEALPFHRLLIGLADPEWRPIVALAVFGGLVILRGGVLAWRDTYLAGLQLGYAEQVRAQALSAIGDASWSDLARASDGTVLQALTLDIQQVGSAVQQLIQSATAAVTVAGNLAFAFILSPRLALAMIVPAAGILIAVPLVRRAGLLGQQLLARQQQVNDLIVQLLAGLKSAKAQGIDARLVATIKTESQAALHARLAFVRLQSVARNVWTVLAAVAGIGGAVMGLLVWHIAPSTVVAFLLVVSRAVTPVATLHQGIQTVSQLAASFAAIAALRTTLTTPASRYPIAIGRAAGTSSGITAIALSHSWPDASPLGPISLHIESGAILGISGPSGVGKTTFVDLVVGLLTPQDGMVLHDGWVLGSRDAPERSGIAYVGQEATLFGATLRQAFALSAPDVGESGIGDALRRVGAEAIVARLPLGLDTRIGSRISPFSSGERQRLAIACAIVGQPQLLVLDEATNALDASSEARLLDELAMLSPRPTILLVAHRDRALEHCERILTFGSDGVPRETVDEAPVREGRRQWR